MIRIPTFRNHQGHSPGHWLCKIGFHRPLLVRRFTGSVAVSWERVCKRCGEAVK